MTYFIHNIDGSLAITSYAKKDFVPDFHHLASEDFPVIKYFDAAFLNEDKIDYHLDKLKIAKLKEIESQIALMTIDEEQKTFKRANAKYVIENSNDIQSVLNYTI